MKKRQLGNSGIAVHPIGVGLWAMGGSQWGPTEDRESLQVIDRALELGIDFYDTADVYGDGHSEELLGTAMRGRRDRFVLGTKIGWVGYDGDAVTSAYTSPSKVVEGIEANLKRLQTDYIDLLQWHVHFEDPTTEHFIAGSQTLKDQGKIRGGLAMGILTGKFSSENTFDADDFRSAWKTDPDQNQQFQADLKTVNKLREAGPSNARYD